MDQIENYRLNLQIQTSENGITPISITTTATTTLASNKQSNNNNERATTAVSTTTTTTTAKPTSATSAATNSKSTKTSLYKIESMQPQQQQQQQHPQLTNGNIILLRGTRNENGQIIIQNKQDILNLLSEQQQQQQQQQLLLNEKTTAISLNQLPTTTTVARKAILQTTSSSAASTAAATSTSTTSSSISIVANNNNSHAKDAITATATTTTASNTILLQTPINASQLESVLLQTANLKKSTQATQATAAARATTTNCNTTTATTTNNNERPFLLKNCSRSLSTDSNRDSKSPFVLQTLKRLEKSQSILVIRNTTTTTTTTTNNAAGNNIGRCIKQQQSAASNMRARSTGAPATTTATTTTAAITNAPATVNVSTNTQTPLSLSLTRATKVKPTNAQTQTQTLLNGSNRSLATVAAAAAAAAQAATQATTTTTTYLRLGNGATTLALGPKTFASKNVSKAHAIEAASASASVTTTLVDLQQHLKGAQERSGSSSSSNVATIGSATTITTTTSAAASSTAAGAAAATAVDKINVPLGSDGEPIKLPDNLESLPRADSFPSQRHRWNTNEEIAALLISFDKHSEWQSKEVKTRPKSGSLLLYSRKKVRYRRDGYCWKKRKDGKTTREDHMKLKVQGTECIYGCYVHSAILPTFHRRCYWLLQNPDIVLVHYLNVPYPDDNKMAVIAPSITLWGDKKEWSKEELVSQLKPMLSTVTSDDDVDSGNDIEISTSETVESIVCQLMEKQRLSRQAALVKQLDCGCGDANCADGKTCTHPVMRRAGHLKSVSEKRAAHNESFNHATGGTPNVVVASKLYSRWSERHQRHQRDANNLDNHHAQYHNATQQLSQESAIKFQIIPSQQHQQQQQQHNELAAYHHQQQQQQQHQQQHQQQQHYFGQNNIAVNQMLATKNNLIIQQQQQQHHHQQQQQANYNQQQQQQNAANQMNLQRYIANSSNNNNNNTQLGHRMQIANTTITATTTVAASAVAAAAAAGAAITEQNSSKIMNAELIAIQSQNSTNSNCNKINRNANNNNNSNSNNNNNNGNQLATTAQLQQQQQQEQQRQNNDLNAVNNNGSSSNNNNNNNSNNNFNYNQQQQINITNTAAQQQYYKLQQQQQQQQQQQRQQQQQATTASSVGTSTVEPMCMSPEHQPTAVLGLHNHNNNNSENEHNHNNNNNNGSHARNQPLQAHSTITPSTSTSTSSSSATITSSSSSNSSSSSSLPSMIDGKLLNQQQPQQQQQQQQHATPSILSSVNLMNTDEAGSVADLGSKMTTSNENQQQQNASNESQSTNEYNNNNNNNSNNKTNENGCASICASSENSRTSISSNASDNQANTLGFESVELNNNSNNNNANEKSTVTNDKQGSDSSGGGGELHEGLSFFNETLDLSHEDIQRTLIANMPFATAETTKAELDYISNNGSSDINQKAQQQQQKQQHAADDAVSANQTEAVAATGDDEDAEDVFANLDAFDMLVEFPELDLDDKQALSSTALEHAQNMQHAAYAGLTSCAEAIAQSSDCNRKLQMICDFSPEWSYPEGGVKVLVAGPWTSNATYTVLFDAQPVPTVLVQEGVLRCYCPAHDVGFATLQVAIGNFIVSNSVMFEYKMSLLAEVPFDATASNDCLYKFTLLNRLSTIDNKLQIKAEGETETDPTSLYLEPSFEEKLVGYCHKLTKHVWCVNSGYNWSSGFRGMTLLHLAGALGYPKLICALLSWRQENPHIILETELDALSQDMHGYTPLAWACVRGHIEAATILYKWNHNALKIKNKLQQTPLDLAHLKGYKQLLTQIVRLENERCRKQQPRGGFNSLSMQVYKNLNSTDDGGEEHGALGGYELELQRSHDGVFLRPVAVASNQSPPNNSRYSKRSSIDSGINMDIRSKTGKPLSRLHSSYETHDNYALAVESPLDTLAATNSLLSPLRKMDFALCEVSTGDSSPIHDKDNDCDDSSTIVNDDVTDVTINNEIADGVVGDSDAKVLTLAEQIIAAMPDRIKNEADEMMVLGSPMTEPLNSESNALTDSFMDPLLDTLPNTHFENDFSFDFHDHSYRYHDVSTPCSSLSPASSGPLQSPASYSILGTDPSVSSPSPPPSTKQLTEFLHASSSSQYPFEADFSKLTLTDTEQRELYEAAKCIQKAYRSYKGRQKLEEQNKERTAAIVIQNYYRRYKQYAYYRQMTNAALVIQHGYRSYCRNKRFKKSQTSSSCLSANGDGSSEHGSASASNSSQCLSSFYDHYKQDQQQQQQQHQDMSSQPSTPKETSPSGPLKRTYSQSTQNQAARKIQQFMRQSRIKLQKERAEKEKLVHQRRAEYLQNLQYQGLQEMSVCQRENNDLHNNANGMFQ